MEWFEYSESDIRDDFEKQKELFQIMLHMLEKNGDCRFVFHRLASVLFEDSLSEESEE